MKILIIRFSSLGDCVLLVPLAAYLKSQGAEEVTVVTKNAYVEVFATARGVDRVIGYDPKTGLRGLFRIAAANRARGYRVIDAHNNPRSRLLSALMGGACCRFRKHYRERVGLILLKRPAALPSILKLYADLAEPAGFPPPQLAPGGLVVPERIEKQAKERLRGGERGFVALAPGSKWPMKRWEREKYLILSRRLVETHGYDLLLMGDEDDLAVTSLIANELGTRCVDITGRTSIIEGAGYLKQCKVLIGNDSGLMHLAEAVAVPVVAIFGPTVEAFGYYPALPRSKTIEKDIPCRPCSRNGSRPCPIKTHECIAGIGVDTVESAVVELLNNAGPARYILTS